MMGVGDGYTNTDVAGDIFGMNIADMKVQALKLADKRLVLESINACKTYLSQAG